MSRLQDIEGLGEEYAAKLTAAGVATQADLLTAGATSKGRDELAEKSGVSGALLLKWINRVDLARIKGVAKEYSDLLEAAGVDTVPELAQRRPDHLYQKLVEVNAEKQLVRQLPAEAMVADWIAQAKDLPRVVTY